MNHRRPPPPPAAADSWAFSHESQLPPRTSDDQLLDFVNGWMQESDLQQALLRTTLELETTRAEAREQLLHLTNLLDAAIRERDEARLQSHSLLLLFMENNQQQQPTNLDEGSNSESESFVSSAAERRGLPEKGRLVEAVMGAGPLLQTLLLAGPLPQWQHPPPELQSFEIPPVSIPVSGRAVGFCGVSPSSPSSSPADGSRSGESNSSSSGQLRRIINPSNM